MTGYCPGHQCVRRLDRYPGNREDGMEVAEPVSGSGVRRAAINLVQTRTAMADQPLKILDFISYIAEMAKEFAATSSINNILTIVMKHIGKIFSPAKLVSTPQGLENRGPEVRHRHRQSGEKAHEHGPAQGHGESQAGYPKTAHRSS